MKWLLAWSSASLLCGLLVASCIPPAGFARTPTPHLPTVSPDEICTDYAKDLARAYLAMKEDLQAQITDLQQAVASGTPPMDALARRIGDRRDSLALTIAHYEKPAPCEKAALGQQRFARTAVFLHRATDFLNIASDEDDLGFYAQALDAYRQALATLLTPVVAP